MGDLAQALCLFCTVITGAPAPQLADTAGDIKYRHEVLGHGKHLLRLSVDYYLVEPEAAMRRRLEGFAQGYAQHTCPGRFAFVDGGSRYLRTENVTPFAKQFVFQCLNR
jgi:hypothetical protein